MDTGHYNCRDYHISPKVTPVTAIGTVRPSIHRDESYQELMERSRSPASLQPKFPLLKLPLELRQLIFSFILPRTTDLNGSNGASPRDDRSQATSHVIWLRGNVSVMQTCSQLHQECAEMLYGRSTFLLFLNYAGISFRFRWLMLHGVAPSRNYPFLELIPKRYLQLIRRVIIHVDHVDSYTGMMNFNVGGKGLIHGLRKQVTRLVTALQPKPDGLEHSITKELSRVTVRISTANAVIDSLNRRKPRDASTLRKLSDREVAQQKLQTKDIQDVLEPFGDLMGVNEVHILGAVTDDFADDLEAKMRSREPRIMHACCADEALLDKAKPILCVYGNDI